MVLLLAAVTPGSLAQPVSTVATALAAGGGPSFAGSSSSSSSFASASSSMSALSGGSGGGGGPSGECQTVTQTSSSSCASGNCCEVKQRVTLCPKHTSALASINGNVGSCCVVLASKANGAPTAFCAAPTTKGGSQLFPSGVAVTLLPDCSNTPAGSAGSLTCTAFFAKLPRGYTLPPTRANLAIGAGVAPWTGELPPCGNGGYRGFRQTAVVDKAGATTFISKCIA